MRGTFRLAADLYGIAGAVRDRVARFDAQLLLFKTLAGYRASAGGESAFGVARHTAVVVRAVGVSALSLAGGVVRGDHDADSAVRGVLSQSRRKSDAGADHAV